VNRNSFLLACAAAIALIAAAYANSLGNSFHFDDSHVIENNLFIRSLSNAPRFFTDAHTFSAAPQNATYRPLVTLSLALDYARARGLDPRPFHITQIALLMIVWTLLVAFFIPVLEYGGNAAALPSSTKAAALPPQSKALFAATLFCVHTANTETMNLISARSELISTIGLLASFVLYQRSPFARRTLLYLVPLAIGALAKAPLVVFAPLLFLYAMYFEHQPPRRALRTALPSLILGIALLIFINAMNAKEWVGGGGSAFHYAITQPFVWLHYARLFVLPIGLTADTDWTTFAQWYDTRALAGYAFIALLIFAIRRARPAVAFGLAWFAIALIPTSLFPLAEVSNEHRVFFAFIGLVLALAAWLPQRTFAIVAIVALIANAIGTHERNKVWATEETLWADVVVKSPANGRAWMNYGLTQMAKGKYEEAKGDFEHAATFTPYYSILEINRGIVEGQLGDQREAEKHFQRALQLNPDANAHFFYARWLANHGRAPEAVTNVGIAVQQSPAFADAQILSLRLAVARGAHRGREWPSYDAAFKAGLLAIQRSNWLDAAMANRDALRHNPRSFDAWNNLGWSLAQLGFRDEAAAAYRAALALQPNDERATNNLRLLQ
jgi:tetratricopeptide (TPR) repeat protein